MMNGRSGKCNYRKFVLNGADGDIFAESLQDTCESCDAVSCALCALYHLNRRIALRTNNNASRDDANDAIRHEENTHVARMNRKYDTNNRFVIEEWERGSNKCVDDDEMIGMVD